MDTIHVHAITKDQRYAELIPQLESLVSSESDRIANLANIAAALKSTFEYYSWIGFYLVHVSSNELVLGPFQGTVACTRIRMGEGVCGRAAVERRTIIVDDVTKFPGHIFCDPDSRSEIVVPLVQNGAVVGVIDVDSYKQSSFDDTDRNYLEKVAQVILHHCFYKRYSFT